MVSGIGGPPPGGKIGGPGAPGSPAPTDGAKPVAGKSFGEVAKTDATRATDAASSTNASPLERLRAGEIDAHRYTELRVQEATAHLDGVLPATDVERIRADLHELIENDPDVAALVKAAQAR